MHLKCFSAFCLTSLSLCWNTKRPSYRSWLLTGQQGTLTWQDTEVPGFVSKSFGPPLEFTDALSADDCHMLEACH